MTSPWSDGDRIQLERMLFDALKEGTMAELFTADDAYAYLKGHRIARYHDCARVIERLRADNERLEKLVASMRPKENHAV